VTQPTSDPLIDPFNHAHKNSDTDLDVDSLHHTLGKGPQQAAPGDHSGHLITGSVNMYAGNVIPAGCLLCDGSAVPRATYPQLFGTIGTTYGVGDGSTTFNLPNFTNAFPRGNAVTPTGGADNHQHNSVSAGTPSGSVGVGAGAANLGTSSSGALVPVGIGNTVASNLHSHTDSGHAHSASFAGNALGGHQHDTQNNIPKYVGLKFIIKT
jgi:microcystin-dependent protein